MCIIYSRLEGTKQGWREVDPCQQHQVLRERRWQTINWKTKGTGRVEHVGHLPPIPSGLGLAGRSYPLCTLCPPIPLLIPLYPVPLCPMATFRTSLHPSQPPEPLSTFSHPFITSSSPHTPLCSQPGYCLWPLPLGTWGCKATKPRSRFWR